MVEVGPSERHRLEIQARFDAALLKMGSPSGNLSFYC